LFGLQILNVDSLQGDQEWTAFACVMDTLSKNQIFGCIDFNDLRFVRWTSFAAPYTCVVGISNKCPFSAFSCPLYWGKVVHRFGAAEIEAAPTFETLK
jgi:hypothetical protein